MLTENRREYLTDYQKKLRKKRKRVEITLDQLEHRELTTKAQTHNQKIGPYIRRAALAYSQDKYLVQDPEQVNRLEVALVRIGNNINQIARRGNKQGLAPIDMTKTYALLNELESIIKTTLTNPPGI